MCSGRQVIAHRQNPSLFLLGWEQQADTGATALAGQWSKLSSCVTGLAKKAMGHGAL
ncbi:hypothetical protein PCL1606_30940 [Pseudomonas chlororaphis]|uniref:Uncharacterized protein n=1 Tax=Pseudomonas chlororaphis TaxID=587753 RepID=A0A0D5XZP8_9PSED|nr:hypothetical protein PCL1606_30940 [Pseudomonas chlororaphis]